MNHMDVVTKGGSGAAISYFALVAPTAWLELLPPLPEGEGGVLLIAAAGVIVTAIIQRFFPRGSPPPKEGDNP